jgi:hypothetical protein
MDKTSAKALNGKTLFSALYGTYTVALQELKALLKASSPAGNSETTKCAASQEDVFNEVRRRKRHITNEDAPTSKKTGCAAEVTPPKEVTTRNFFDPIRTTPMDADAADAQATTHEAVPGKAGRSPPIILTAETNLIHLQKQLKNVVKADFEFRNTRNGTRVITKSMAGFEPVKFHLSNNNLFYFFFPKSQKPIKGVIGHLPPDTPAADICDGLANLGFDVLSVKQVTTTRRGTSDETVTTRNFPLFLITLPRTAKSQEIFHLPSLCHISIRVEAYRAQTGLTQCHNCQQFGHVWANCRHPPRCLWCGGGHLHKECPEKGNPASIPACCNCRLAEREKDHPANYRGCKHAKEELQKRKAQRTPK